MTAALDLDSHLTLDEVKNLTSNDVAGLCWQHDVKVEDSGDYLDGYYQENSRPIREGSSPVYGEFWTKVGEVAAILKDAPTWPFPPLTVREGVLYDGHHRANAAIKVGWDKEIPVTTQFMWW
ncbi:ParB-like nuclease domain protein [Mycobacterium phage Phonnegut]|nr:ParB-like nuclease domain protein [Mycobacterium phage Phonnegut]AVI04382.1 ParB-like nuclease domain protein [Mycobacterium phage Scherzo]QGJ88736.1 ParB-like nuclease domain protein [Mycobacterium phage Beemo]